MKNRFTSALRTGLPTLLAAALLACAHGGAFAQAASGQDPPVSVIPAPGVVQDTTPAATAARGTATSALEGAQGAPVRRLVGQRENVVNDVGTGRAIGDGSRVLRVPGKCDPRTNSLDCVADASQGQGGANVSGRVRNSVIGEVGAGRAATEGSGKTKSQDTCTPAPGKLTCEGGK